MDITSMLLNCEIMTAAVGGGLFGAIMLVTVTTIDDAIWLVPYCVSPQLSLVTKVMHATIFVATIEFLVTLCVLLSLTITKGIQVEQEEIIFGSIGAFLCWIVMFALIIKRILKNRKKRANASIIATNANTETEEDVLLFDNHRVTNGETESSTLLSVIPEREVSNKQLDPCMIISLTTFGALDEISYFPALLIGNIFTPFQLCLGTFIAAILVLIIVVFFLAKFKPLVDCLDRVPLYCIVGVFAVVLTVRVLLDIY